MKKQSAKHWYDILRVRSCVCIDETKRLDREIKMLKKEFKSLKSQVGLLR